MKEKCQKSIDKPKKEHVEELKNMLRLIKDFPPPKGPVFLKMKEYNWRAYK